MNTGEAKYQNLIAALTAAGMRAELHNPDQLVVCTDEPVLTGRIWITWRNQWFISTWTPAIYSVPDDVDVVALCLACVSWESGSFYTIPDKIAQQFRLVRLEQRAVEQLLTADDSSKE